MVHKPGLLVISFLRLIRWPNLLIILLTQSLVLFAILEPVYSGAGTQPALGYFQFFCLVFSTVLIAAAGYVINDYFDTGTDGINKPERVFIGKFFSRQNAVVFYILFNAAAIFTGFYISWKVGSFRLGLIFPLMTVLLWFYSERYKRKVLAGNLAVAFMSAMVVLIVWLFEFYALKLQPDKFMTIYTRLSFMNRIVLAYSLFAFLITLVRELIKDAEDIEGDSISGCRTFPVVYGAANSKILAVSLLAIILTLVSTCVVKLAGSYHLPVPAFYYALMVAAPIAFIIVKIARSGTKLQFHQVSILLKLVMLTGILGMIPLSLYL